MKVLVINSGSSTIKYSVLEMNQEPKLLLKGIKERVSTDHRVAMHDVLDEINKSGLKIEAVGHRVVHGGESLRKPTLINQEVIDQIVKAGRFVPLHAKPNLIGIEVTQEMLPHIPQVAIFDTSAFVTLPLRAFLYAIPWEYYEKHKIRRYGFHGINHQYVAEQASKTLKKKKIITCHLGSGCSIAAFDNGKAIDTSMGLTPLEGLVMGTRSGDIDPSIIFYLSDVLGMKTAEIMEVLNKKSGLLGLSGKNDMRDIVAKAEKGDKHSQTAIEIFVYRVQKYIGAYMAALNGAEGIVFTGGIGENSPYIREKILANFDYAGVKMDRGKNQQNALIFSFEDSKMALMTIKANEEFAIAEQTFGLLKETTYG